MRSERNLREGSFQIEQEVVFAAGREAVWARLCDVDGWWCHRFGKGPLCLEARVGGRFEERWGDGEGALWGVVTFVRRPEVLRLSGPLGMDTPVNSVYEFALEEAGDGRTRLKLSHRCVGIIDDRWGAAHGEGWGELWGHLKRFVESGARFGG